MSFDQFKRFWNAHKLRPLYWPNIASNSIHINDGWTWISVQFGVGGPGQRCLNFFIIPTYKFLGIEKIKGAQRWSTVVGRSVWVGIVLGESCKRKSFDLSRKEAKTFTSILNWVKRGFDAETIRKLTACDCRSYGVVAGWNYADKWETIPLINWLRGPSPLSRGDRHSYPPRVPHGSPGGPIALSPRHLHHYCRSPSQQEASSLLIISQSEEISYTILFWLDDFESRRSRLSWRHCLE